MKTEFDWGELAFGSKKPLRELDAIFIVAPRELSTHRFAQLIKHYLPKGNIILGLAKETYVLGFEDQPQFRMLELDESFKKLIAKINASSSKNKIYTLTYFQREFKHVIDKITFQKVLLVNGSWKYVFHNSEAYYILANRQIDYEMISPFASEAEALEYNERIGDEMRLINWSKEPTGTFTEEEMLAFADKVAKLSFDHSFQCGVTLGRKTDKGYEYLASTFNEVVPFQTYALHYGASREINFSPPHDLNHYDTIHAEVAMIIKAAEQKIDLNGTTLFINLLPCPSCARMFTQTTIAEFVYVQDHSAGYAVSLLEKAGKVIRRVVAQPNQKEG
ncbi:MAG: hypothetical protein JWP06_320 [Candidatus Saccharibacteria bacterium]|nr:hypothetical protein [Candidatus Saccharibacteria bacterium]